MREPHGFGHPFVQDPHAVVLFQRGCQDGLLPENGAVAAVEADQDAVLCFFETGGDEDAIECSSGRSRTFRKESTP